eukprot:gene3379-biopygen18733
MTVETAKRPVHDVCLRPRDAARAAFAARFSTFASAFAAGASRAVRMRLVTSAGSLTASASRSWDFIREQQQRARASCTQLHPRRALYRCYQLWACLWPQAAQRPEALKIWHTAQGALDAVQAGEPPVREDLAVELHHDGVECPCEPRVVRVWDLGGASGGTAQQTPRARCAFLLFTLVRFCELEDFAEEAGPQALADELYQRAPGARRDVSGRGIASPRSRSPRHARQLSRNQRASSLLPR